MPANERQLPDGRVAYRMKRPLATGTEVLMLEPSERLRRLAALLPPPRSHLVRYHGLCRPQHRPCYAHLETMLSWAPALPNPCGTSCM